MRIFRQYVPSEKVVWSKSTMVGCGKATGPDGNDYWVCNYDPAGNVVGQTPLE
ncbi:MAG: CAP domain-containing protein [Pseudonocardiaceae bacterium]